MRGFLVKNKKPVCKWGNLPEGTFFKGKIPEGYNLAISPSKGYIIVDVDYNPEKGKNGYSNVPNYLTDEFNKTLQYYTKSGGMHYWFQYTGNQELANKSSSLNIDLRTHNGYVVWYCERDFFEVKHLIKPTSLLLNDWLESNFGYKK